MNIRKWLPHAATLTLAAVLVITQHVWADPIVARLTATTTATSKTTINYQGYLTDSSGNPVNEPVDMVFRLYNVESGGEALWIETQNGVVVSDGLFSVLLGDVTSISTEIIANNSDLWLGIAVGGDEEMSPRERIASAPYAMLANVPDGSITSAKIADGAVTSAKLEHSGPHIPITPDENGLVKMAVLRQDSTTNTYSKDQVIVIGWGYKQGDESDEMSEAVDFGITFSTAPIVLTAMAGQRPVASGAPSSSGDFDIDSIKKVTCTKDVTTTGFTIYMGGETLGNDRYWGYTWIAIGTLE